MRKGVFILTGLFQSCEEMADVASAVPGGWEVVVLPACQEDLEEYLEKCLQQISEFDQVALIGWSFGAQLAQLMVGRTSGVTHLVLIAGSQQSQFSWLRGPLQLLVLKAVARLGFQRVIGTLYPRLSRLMKQGDYLLRQNPEAALAAAKAYCEANASAAEEACRRVPFRWLVSPGGDAVVPLYLQEDLARRLDLKSALILDTDHYGIVHHGDTLACIAEILAS